MIGDFLFQRNEKQAPSDDAPLMAFIANIGVAPKGERYDRSFLVKDENKQYKRTEYNDFIYSSNNLDVGSIGLNKYGTAVISDVYEIFSISDETTPYFISEAIMQPNIINDILKYRQGVTYGQYRIYAEDFLGVKIKLPPLHIQKVYSKIFEEIERRITLENQKLQLLCSEKTYFMQKMFI